MESLKAEMMIPQNFKKQSTSNQILIPLEMAGIIKSNTSFPNLYKLLNIAYTIPINNATRERASSIMRLLKNWLCSTISQNCFSNLALLSIEREIRIDEYIVICKL